MVFTLDILINEAGKFYLALDFHTAALNLLCHTDYAV